MSAPNVILDLVKRFEDNAAGLFISHGPVRFC
jgi:hypothetical protein